MYLDETASLCDLLLPEHHALERWDDARAACRRARSDAAGHGAGVQHHALRVTCCSRCRRRPAARSPSSTRRRIRRTSGAGGTRSAQQGEKDTEAFWRAALQRGGLYQEAPAAPHRFARRGRDGVTYTRPAFEGKGDFVLVAYPHALLHDGRGANKPWLLENADPVTKITWHSWVEVEPETARKLDVRDGEILRLTTPHGTLELPAYVYLGLNPDVIAVPLGLGHTAYGAFAKGRGVNALDLLGAPEGRFPSVRLHPGVGRRRPVAIASSRASPAIRASSAADRRGDAAAAAKKGLTVKEAYLEEGHPEHEVNTALEVAALKGWSEAEHEATSSGDYASDHPQWGMAIDLARCTGCQACVTACYAENNIPTVGESEVLRGREMTWMRIERYWEGGEEPGEPVVGALRPDAVPALRQRAVRAGVPRVRRLSHGRRPQRPGVQPLRGHPLLRQQLSRTRCATSTGTSTTRWPGRSRSTCSSIPT